MSVVLRPNALPPSALPPAGGGYEPDPMASGMSPLEYLAILKRRRWIILAVFLLVTAVGIIVTLLTPKVYEAQSKLVVDPPSYTVNTASTDNPLAAIMATGSSQNVQTQVELLQTVPVQSQVLQQIGAPAQFAVSNEKDTNIITVVASASDPKVAADAANGLLNNYISQSADQEVAGLASTYQFVKTQGADAHARLLTAENKLNNFQKTNHIVNLSQNQSDQISRVTGLSNQLLSDQGQMAVLQARLAADRQAFASQPVTLPVTTQGTNPALVGLQNAIDNLQVQYASVTQPGMGFNPKAKNPAPQLRALNAQIAELKGQLARAPQLIATQTTTANPVRETLRAAIVDLGAQIASQGQQVGHTQAALNAAQASVSKFPDYALTLGRLTRDRDDALASDQKFAAQLADLSLKEKARHASAHLVQPAYPARYPVRPNKALNIGFAALIGLFLGICLTLLQEFLDDRINTVEDADRVLALPSLGKVPTLTTADARLLPQMTRADPAAESYRVLRTNIHFSSLDTPLKTMLVTSSGPGEGKTTTAVNLAFAMVMDGKRVILVDTDLRRPAIHKMLGLPTMPGMTDVLAGTANLDDVLMQHSDMPGLMALTAGTVPPNPSELLGSQKFRSLLAELTEQADLVILDSPPALAAADAQILASQADGTVLVVETGETRKSAARHTLALLRHARANVLGVAYNKLAHLDGYYYHYATPALPDDMSRTKGRNGNALLSPAPGIPPAGSPMTQPSAEAAAPISGDADALPAEKE